MASEKQMYEIIGRAIADPSFRDNLMKDPQKTAESLGYLLEPGQIKSLQDSDLGSISDELATRISKMGLGCGPAGFGYYSGGSSSV